MTKVKVIIEGQRFVIYKSCVSHNSKTDKGNSIKLYRKIKQNKKVCREQNLGSHDQIQGHNPMSKVLSLINRVSAISQKPMKGI